MLKMCICPRTAARIWPTTDKEHTEQYPKTQRQYTLRAAMNRSAFFLHRHACVHVVTTFLDRERKHLCLLCVRVHLIAVSLLNCGNTQSVVAFHPLFTTHVSAATICLCVQINCVQWVMCISQSAKTARPFGSVYGQRARAIRFLSEYSDWSKIHTN